MFIDYYSLLEVEVNATQEEIKAAFKKQALKWHPDRNSENDTTLYMQQINEAYLILKDIEARNHYNKEYKRFKEYQQQKEQEHFNEKEKKRENEYTEYKIYDEILKKWIKNAKHQAVDLAKQTIEDFKGISTAGAKAVAEETTQGILFYIVFNILIFFILTLIQTCPSV